MSSNEEEKPTPAELSCHQITRGTTGTSMTEHFRDRPTSLAVTAQLDQNISLPPAVVTHGRVGLLLAIIENKKKLFLIRKALVYLKSTISYFHVHLCRDHNDGICRLAIYFHLSCTTPSLT